MTGFDILSDDFPGLPEQDTIHVISMMTGKRTIYFR
jgi:hypothetical protein